MSSRNRRRHQHKVPIASLSPGLLLAAVVLIGGITWVYMKHQLVVRGAVITGLEREITDLRARNDSLRTRIGDLASYPNLKKQLADGFINMTPIEPAYVVTVPFRSGTEAIAAIQDSEIVPVANTLANTAANTAVR